MTKSAKSPGENKRKICKTIPKIVKLKQPLLVCKSPMCICSIISGNETTTEYKCSSKVKNQFDIRRQKWIHCRDCKCYRNQHEVISYDIILQKELIDREAAHTNIAELEAEQKTIVDSSAKFAHVLQMNAITPYNDKMIEYLEYYKHNADAADK